MLFSDPTIPRTDFFVPKSIRRRRDNQSNLTWTPRVTKASIFFRECRTVAANTPRMVLVGVWMSKYVENLSAYGAWEWKYCGRFCPIRSHSQSRKMRTFVSVQLLHLLPYLESSGCIRSKRGAPHQTHYNQKCYKVPKLHISFLFSIEYQQIVHWYSGQLLVNIKVDIKMQIINVWIY